MFGHEKGAFTGAVARRIGKFEEANGGTLLLDEISEMDARLQAKLLRAIQEREIDRVGGTKPVKVDIRIIATSNRDLAEAVKRGTFREDLLYRLNVVNLRLPALRERPKDILALAEPLRAEICAGERRAVSRPIAPTTERLLLTHPWRGNVRELENTMHRAVLLATGSEIPPEAIRLPDGTHVGPGRTGDLPGPVKAAVETARRRHARPRRTHGRRCRARSHPRHARPLPRQPHPCREHPRHLDPHAAQQAARIFGSPGLADSAITANSARLNG